MSKDANSDLEELGRMAAQQVAGNGSVEQVAVAPGEDSSDRPVYYFSFLIDQSRTRHRVGLIYTRLVQKLRDELIARGDGHLPVIQILDREDWGKRADARFP